MQRPIPKFLSIAMALAMAFVAMPVLADSSSVFSTSSTSVGSSSVSIEKSSNSVSSKDKLAQGPYTVVEMTALAQQPDKVRVQLQPAAPLATEAIFLVLPREAAERGQLATGQTVTAMHRPYGIALTAGNATDSAKPFFLVLDDDWYRELESRPVV
jgi:hypothetical protein